MKTYTKLFSLILDSSVWQQPAATRLLWITMLAKKDKDGIVWAALPGLAHIARISLDEANAAMDVFMAPDPYSRSKDDDGRRVEAVDGGWRVINHFRYRDEMEDDHKRAQASERQKRFRLSKQGVVPLQGETVREAIRRAVRENNSNQIEISQQINSQPPPP